MNVPDDLLRGLDDAQGDAVVHPADRLCVTAGPGSGKTRVLTRRVAWQATTGVTTVERCLVMTFTRAAATEFRGRLGRLGVSDATVGTFHAVSSALLQQRLAEERRPRPTLIPSRQRLLGDAIDRIGVEGLTPRAVDTELTWANSRLITVEDYANVALEARRPLRASADQVAAVMLAYENDKHRKGVVDFDDLVVMTVRRMESDPGWVEALRWRFRHLYVDEYQDTSHAQLRFLQLLHGDGGSAGQITVVGDPDQSVFGFSGVDPDGFDKFTHDFAGGEVVQLTVNHRSTPAIVAATAGVLGRDLTASKEGHNEPPTITVYDTEDDEAHGVADRLRTLGQPWSRRAVLARSNKQLDRIEVACNLRGIPTVRPQDLASRPEVRQVLNGLSRSEREPVSASRGRLRELVDEAREMLMPRHSCDGTFDVDVVGDEAATAELAVPLSTAAAFMHLDELTAMFEEFIVLAPDASVGAFKDWLATSMRGPGGAPQSTGHAVELRTIHRAKGLEWDDVIVIGCDDNSLVDDGSEESRIAYVAFSRPTLRLHCTWARTKTIFGRDVSVAASPHLAAVENARAVPVPEVDTAAVIRTARSRLKAAIDHPAPQLGAPAVPGVLRQSRPELVDAVHGAATHDDARRTAVAEIARRLRTTPQQLLADAARDPRLQHYLDASITQILLADIAS